MTKGATTWGYATEQAAPPLLRLALEALRREKAPLVSLASCTGDPCGWVRGVAECLAKGQCRGALIFCASASPACCVANKVKGIRAAKIDTLNELEQATSPD